MEHNLNHTIALLARTPGTLEALLRGLPDEWTHANEGGASWSAIDAVGHLIYADREDWIPRARRILEFGVSKPFEPFDRQGHVRECQGKSLGELLDEFAHVRHEKLGELHALNLQPADLEKRGRHPALGTVTLGELLATWAAHDLTHLHQISRIMARQYGEEAGPFRKFLGVLNCDGHGG
jgi:hypothetical protein